MPIDENGIRRIARSSRIVASVEENSVFGGLGGSIAEIISTMESHGLLIRYGIKEKYSDQIGSSSFLRRCYGIDAESIVAGIEERIRKA